MVPVTSLSMGNEADIVVEKSVSRAISIKKNPTKIPKKIHKAEREKLKRDNLNDLFLELGHILEPTRQCNGKASILCDATRLLRDLFQQVQSLKKENAALLTESHYVTVEKDELKDENTLLEIEIEKLRNDLSERIQAVPTWPDGKNVAIIQSQHVSSASSLSKDQPLLPMVDSVIQPSPATGPPVILIPLHDLQSYSHSETGAEAGGEPLKPLPQVKRPHPRYPSPSDSWPSRLLLKQPRTSQGRDQESGSTVTSDNGEEGSNENERRNGSS